jgi:hypothetical protein
LAGEVQNGGARANALRALAVCSLVAFFQLELAAAVQPHMHDAMAALEHARASLSIADLAEARKALNHAGHEKGGFEKDALKAVEQAIAAVKAGKNVDAGKHIESAIAATQKGINEGHRDKK